MQSLLRLQRNPVLASCLQDFSGRNRNYRFFKSLSSAEIRHKFQQYFIEAGHHPVKSSSLIPHNDKSLLFTNAGMVQFKEFFLKPEDAPFKTAVSIQKCMRAGGKHNDLDNVGHTPRHHTFFEMLGNFSFGDYSKAQAIRYAWNFLTDVLELPKDRLRVTVLANDQESYDIWKNQENISEDRIIRCSEKDNFWSMSDGEGACGPCTEIFWDTKDDSLGEDRWLEIWNLVFIQNFRKADGTLEVLSIPCVDTGMGMERLASVLQGKKSNFEIDEFQTLIGGLNKVMSEYGLPKANIKEPSVHEKIVVDHFRAMCFLIGDGVIPSNVGRGYVLRRIIRRAIRSGQQLGFKTPFMAKIYPYLASSLGNEIYPDIISRGTSIKNIIENEEIGFMGTLEKGMKLLEDSVFKNPQLISTKHIPPAVAFQLYDTYGFPLDLTMLIAMERGWTLDVNAVEELQETNKKLSQASWKSYDIFDKAHLIDWRANGIFPTFTGYDHSLLHHESKIIAVNISPDGASVMISIDPCPFYGMGGGQIPDTGYITLSNDRKLSVVDVFQPYEGGLVLKLEPDGMGKEKDTNTSLTNYREFLQVGQFVRTYVDIERRKGTEAHHTATHLLNAALRKILKSDGIVQAGSLVESDRLRFDFTYGKNIEKEQLKEIEDWVNQACLSYVNPVVRHMPLNDALKSGAIGLFSEKYTEIVRVVEVPNFATELCGGTHVSNIGTIFPFKIINEGSVALGTRRIEATVGQSALKWYNNQLELIPRLMEMMKVKSSKDLERRFQRLLDENKELKYQNDRLCDEKARNTTDAPIIGKYKDTRIELHHINIEHDPIFLTKRAKYLRDSSPNAIHVLASNNRVLVTLNPESLPDLNAGHIIKEILEHLPDGKGGGNAHTAYGHVNESVASVKSIHTALLRACNILDSTNN